MRYNIKYKNSSGYTKNTRITARNSEEAIKKFHNEYRGSTLLNIYADESTTTTKRSTKNQSLISNINSLSPEEKKKLLQRVTKTAIIAFSLALIFFMGITAYFLISWYSIDYIVKHLIYSILLILGIALVVFLNILYFKRQKNNNVNDQ